MALCLVAMLEKMVNEITGCAKCGECLSESARFCLACGEDAGFPNVRMATRLEEVEHFEKRLATAFASAEAGGYLHALQGLGKAASASKAVIARPLRILLDLLENDRRPYSTYHMELNAGLRVPEDNVYDRTRTQFENALFPQFYVEIRYAALSLEGRWLHWFGDYAMILKEHMIGHRTTVFEENPYLFAKKHNLRMLDAFPPGYRTVWARRGELAMAKLFTRLDSNTDSAKYSSILMSGGSTDGSADYIEAHIFGPFNRSAIERIVGPVPKSREDKLLWRQLKRVAARSGVGVEEL